MSLRFILILSIFSMMLLSLIAGSGVSWFHAVRAVRAEMEAALSVGTHTAENAVAHLVGAESPETDLKALIATFDGNRHLRATLTDGGGTVLATSSLLIPPNPVPRWFGKIVAGKELESRVALPSNVVGGGWVILDTDPQNEMTEDWTEFGDNLRTLIVFGVFSFLLIYWIIGRTLRPLDNLSHAFGNVGSSASFAPVEIEGPPELAGLARSFNSMVGRLAAAEQNNQRLNEQLLTIQEEERAELARDLHDDIGPYLFAISVDAAAVQRSVESRSYDNIPADLLSIRKGVSHIQKQVREILGRLRSGSLAQFGLSQALTNFVAFWRSRHAEVTIALDVSAANEGFGEALDGTIYRIIQESLNNAMRHGKPRRIDIVVDTSTPDEILVTVSDDGGGLKWSAETRGFGLRGMAERVTSLGGDLSVRDRADGAGVTVTASLPSPIDLDAIA